MIVDIDTWKQKAVDDNTAFVVGGLVIEKVHTDVSFYYVGCVYCKKRMIGNLRCERHACVNGNTYFLVRLCRRVGHGSFYAADLI